MRGRIAQSVFGRLSIYELTSPGTMARNHIKLGVSYVLLVSIFLNSLVTSSALKPTVWKHLRSITSYVLIHVPFMHCRVQSPLYVDIMVVQSPLIRISIYRPTKKFTTVRVIILTFLHANSIRANCR